MLDPMWVTLSALTGLVGVLIILAPKFVVTVNDRLSKTIVSMDDLVLRHRHVMGALLLIVAYLCFWIALLLTQQ